MNLKPLTSLRFFFAFMVMASHLLFLKHSSYFKNFYDNYLFEGFLGVSFFYILSEFILSLNYYELKPSKESFIKFYKARIARIYPVHLITLIIAAILLVKNFSLKTFLMQLFLVQSFSSDQKVYFSFNAPSWSISDELFFYLIFPLLIIIFRKLKTSAKTILFLAITITILGLNILLPESKKHYLIYIFPLSRLADFILGILLFQICQFLRTKEIKSTTIILFQIIAVLSFVLTYIFHSDISISYRFSIYYWLPISLTILSLSSEYYCQAETLLTKILSNKILVYLGQISFAFYMTHLLVIDILHLYFVIPNHIIKTGLIIIITLTASIFNFEKVEKPANKLIKTL
ncbi:acyltransferase family protein [Soonwooa sp.]|uniref:acyltransferase family protein n=1 Tax=Soonwooa sp. TaxID=1938592 RepID=UPI0039180261